MSATTMGFGEALSVLATKQKTSKGAPAYSRFVNRKLGRVLAAACYVAGLTPNQVTVISALLSGTGIVLIAAVGPALWQGVAVTVALVLGYAFDAADGQLARLRGGGSIAGEWLDHIVDCAKISLLHGAVLISCYRFFELDRAGYLLIPFGFLVVATVQFFGMILTDQLRRLHRTTTGSVPAEPARPSVLRSLLVIPTDYGLLCLAFLLLAAQDVFFVVYTALFAGNLVLLAAALAKWFRELAALPPAPAASQQAVPAGPLPVPQGRRP